MSLTDDQIVAKNFQKFYNGILPYLNGSAHSGFTPIGTVISVMGTTAPLNYLACDGTVYNIADYSELAAYFNQQFGSSNFFGGDGTTTFAVPDLRGEFLRGTGTNSHANQGSGANVGVHQDGTTTGLTYSNNLGTIISTEPDLIASNTDYLFNVTRHYGSVSSHGSDNTGQAYTSRPTNTSVLYCIASKNIFMDAGSNYSTEEQVVGTWINGSVLYQRSFYATTPNSTNDTAIITLESYVRVKKLDGIIYTENSPDYIPVNYQGSTSNWLSRTYVQNDSKIHQQVAGYVNKPEIITLQYTKTTD